MAAVNELDLELAWRRAMQDRPDRVFVGHPYLIDVIDSDRDGWLNAVKQKLLGGYAPHDCTICYSPKPNWLVRPGGVLRLDDEVVFNAVLGQFHEKLWEHIGWSQGDPDVGYRLTQPSKTPMWVKNDFSVWAEWRTKSLKALDDGVFFVLTTDITGFYENIDLPRLASDLKSLNLNPELHQLLMSLLNRWAGPRGKGIPQGYSGSDILAKVYLDSVDRGMRNAGFKHLRYVDDIRVFCKSSLEAKRALLTLNDLIRKRGLNLQSAKTRILRVDEARQEIDGVSPLIHSISQQLAKELKEFSGSAGNYGSLHDIEQFLLRNPHAPPPEILERAFSEHFLASGDRFDKTLFHYLLTRLGKVASDHAVDYCLRTLTYRPEETKYILRYIASFPLSESTRDRLLDCLESTESAYDYPLYEIVRWFYDRHTLDERLLRICRRWMFDKNRPTWLRVYCLAIVAEFGDSSDLDIIEGQYASAASQVERLEIVVSLSRMETGRRNAFLGRVKEDGFLVQKAAAFVRGQGHRGT